MYKQLLIFLLIIASFTPLFSQDFKVESFSLIPNDISARTKSEDWKGEKCALIKVQLPQDGFKFKGDVKKLQFFVNEYWVYMAPGAKELQIISPDWDVVNIKFSQYSNESIRSGATYLLSFSQNLGYKIGIYDEERVYNSIPEVAQEYKTIKSAEIKYKEDNDKLIEEYKRKEDELARLDKDVPEAIRVRRTKELENFKDKIEEFKARADKDLELLQLHFQMNPYTDKIKEAIKIVEGKMDLISTQDYTFARQTGVKYEDITDEVLEVLKGLIK